MEYYNLLCTNALNKIDFKLSQLGFAYSCTYAISNRIQNFPGDANIDIECLYSLEINNTLFIDCGVPNISECLNKVILMLNNKQIKLNFFLMYEPIVPKHIVDILLPYTIHMFLQNNIYDDPKIHQMPIGIRDGEEIFPIHKHFSQKILLNESIQNRDKKYLCLLCYTNGTQSRINCENILGNKEFIINLNKNIYEPQASLNCGKVPVDINYQYTHESYYVLSPTGCGEATHRFFEAIYLDAIPIVLQTHTAFDKLYNVFPCLVVNNWDEVTEELLKNKLNEKQSDLTIFKNNYPNAYTDINTIHELLLMT